MTSPRDASVARGVTNPPFARRFAHCLRALAFALAALGFGATLPASATDDPAAARPFTICEGQIYALCASAECIMYNGVAYCKCKVEQGDSISLSLNWGRRDVCDFNAKGVRNGYMVSTYSLPPEVVKPGGTEAIYDCPASTATGTYAQCDGGVCFKSTQGQRFPGFPGELAESEIICSCPAVTADPTTAELGYQIVGPYPCDQSFFNYCDSGTANTDNGASIAVGATTGTPRFLTRKLNGSVPPLNHCKAPS